MNNRWMRSSVILLTVFTGRSRARDAPENIARGDSRMDNRDEIIRTQMDVIGTLINNNLRNIGSDLWGEETPTRKPSSPVPSGIDA